MYQNDNDNEFNIVLTHDNYASVGGATRHTVVVLCVCVILSVAGIAHRTLKTKC